MLRAGDPRIRRLASKTVVRVLAHVPKDAWITMGDLAESSGMGYPRTSEAVGDLVDLGVLKRRHPPGDARVVQVARTALRSLAVDTSRVHDDALP